MTSFFLFFAVVGGTLLVGQFGLALLGFFDASDVMGDVPHDVPHDLPHDIPHDVPHDLSSGDATGHPGEAAGQHDSTWLFSIISVRTTIAAMAFFGLAGLAAEAAEQSLPTQIGGALLAGFAAMLAVHYLLKQIGKLASDGTVRIQRALGQTGTVYIPIAAAKSQSGKVQVKVSNQLIEYEAVTSGPLRLATGTKIRVIGIQGTMLEVQPLEESSLAEPLAVKT